MHGSLLGSSEGAVVSTRPLAVVFDMDGVLIDARDWHYRALNEALAVFDAEISMDDHLSRFNGLPTRVKLSMLTDEGRLPAHLHHVVEQVKQERTLREAARLCFPRVEHLLLLGWLRQMGCKLGVATNSVRATSTAMLEFAGILPRLDVLVTNEDIARAKPAPDIYALACELLGVAPEDTLVIEDHPYGVTAAEAAGCRVVQVTGVEDVSTALVETTFARWQAWP